MEIAFNSPEAAFAAVAWIMVTADNTGSDEELDYLSGKLRDLDIFEDYDDDTFSTLIGTVLGQIETRISKSERVDVQISDIGYAASHALNADQRLMAFEMAVELAFTDGICAQEQAALTDLQFCLSIDKPQADQIIIRYEQPGSD
jgi:hypothetical protein